MIAAKHAPPDGDSPNTLRGLASALADYHDALRMLRGDPNALLAALDAHERVLGARLIAPALDAAMDQFQQAIEALPGDQDALLRALLVRDHIAVGWQRAERTVEQGRRLVELDDRLRRRARGYEQLAGWRDSFNPSPEAWWWRIDEREHKRDAIWLVLAGALATLTLPIALDIVKRLWDGAPDTVSLVGTLITLALTTSPLLKQGREISGWLLRGLFKLTPRLHAEIVAATALFALLLVLGARVWLLPALAQTYNESGARALRNGNISVAKQSFRRAVALSPDLVVPYQSLADVYAQIGDYAEAERWYRLAIERDSELGPAYSRLGHLFNLQEQYATAVPLLLAGLDVRYPPESADLELVTRYEILADLGWAYVEQSRFEHAREALEASVALEAQVRDLEQRQGATYRIALPHIQLARVYEQLNRHAEAIREWEASLRFLDADSWRDREQIAMARSHLAQLQRNSP